MTIQNRVIHFEIQADNIERAKTFYKNVFGWKIDKIMKKEEGEMMDYWGIMTGSDKEPGINGGMYERPEDNILNTYDCTIGVADIDKAIDTVKANGGIIKKEKMEISGVGWFANAIDTEGNKFGLMQSTRKEK
jgi:hypothetical protein